VRKRILGNTGLEVSEIGFGAWQLGNVTDWGGMDDACAHTLVAEALDLGVTLFDTAPHYAKTNSERLLGEALVGRRDDVVLVSKFGHSHDGRKDYRVDSFQRSLAESLERLRTDHLDVLLLHNPPLDMLQGRDPLWDALEVERNEGRIRHYGVSLDFAHEIEACLANTGSSVLEVLFNILHQDARRAFSHVEANGAGVIAKVPLDSGWLTGRFHATSRFEGVRARWTKQEIQQRAECIAGLDWLVAEGQPLSQRALAYPLAYPVVSSVIPGTRSLAQLHDSVGAVDCRIEDHERERLETYWNVITDHGERLLPW